MANIGYATLQIIPSLRGVGGRLTADLTGAADGRRAGERIGDDVADGVGSRGSKIGGVLKAGLAAAGVAAGAALVSGVTSALDRGALDDRLAASLGSTPREAKRLGDIASRLYADAWGDSLGEVTDAVAAVRSSLRGLPDSQIEKVTAAALGMASAFDVDVSRAAQVAGQAVTSGLARDATQAVDLLTASMQRVPAAVREDLLDAVDEYGPFLSSIGITGPRAFGLFTAAAEKGMYGIDKTGDALKEFTVRAGNITDTGAQEALTNLGLSGEAMAGRIVAGGQSASDAFGLIVDRLLATEDPAQRAADAVALFGAPLEDLGVSEIPAFLTSLQDTTGALGEVDGAAARVGETLSGNPKTQLQAFGRGVRTDIADAINTVGLPALAGIVSYLDTEAAPAFGRIKTAIGDALTDLDTEYDFSGLFSGIVDDAREYGAGILDGFREALDTGDYSALGVSLGTGVRGALGAIGDLGGSLFDVISDAIGSVDWGSLAVQVGKQVPAILLGFAIGLLDFDFGAIWDVVSNNWLSLLIGVLSIIFLPAKIIGPIAKLLGKIPLVGRFVEWLLTAVNALGPKIGGWVSGIFKKFGDAFLIGGRPLSEVFKRVLDLVRVPVFTWADDLVKWFKNLPKRLTTWLGDWAARLGAGASSLLARFATAVVRLWVSVTGLFARGVAAVMRLVGGWIAGVVRAAVDLGVRVALHVLALWLRARALFTAGVAAVRGIVVGFVSNIVGRVVGLATSIAGHFRAIWSTAGTLFRAGVATVVGVFLGLVGTILDGAAEAFSWVPGIGDKLQEASDNFDTFRDNVNTSLRGIDEERRVQIKAELDATASALVKAGADPAAAAKRVRQIGLATGGRVLGPGTGTSDSIPALLSNGEHVWTAREVERAGGHGAVEVMRREVLRRAKGGPVVRRGVTVSTSIPPTDDFDVLVERLNAGSAALGTSMSGYVDTLAGAAKKAAAARAVAGDPGGPVPALGPGGWARPGRGGRVRSEFGMRSHPITGRYRLHNGIDVAGLAGSRVTAAQAGRVTFAGRQGTYGNVAFIRHANGDQTGYAHLARIMVKVGQQVARMQQVGVEGATGGVTGKHLHFNWKRGGAWTNPRRMGVFDTGGLARGAGYMPKGTLRPERVLDPRQTVAFERLVDAIDRPPGVVAAGPVSVTAPPVYVVNPFTGDYLLAEVDARADRRIEAADRADARARTYRQEA